MSRRVALLPTCVVDAVAADVGMAAVRVLRRCGAEVTVVDDATCCGQPAWNAGFAEEAAVVARTTLRALSVLDDDVTVCVPAGSCATMVKVFWPELFHIAGDDQASTEAQRVSSRVLEFSRLVHDLGFPACAAAPAAVAYHHSCHMLRELRIREEPLALLDGAEGLERVAWDGDERCCGFGGLFSVKQPELSVAMADDKLDSLCATGAEVLVGADQSCLFQLEGRLRRRGEAVEVRHLAQVLDDASADATPQADGERVR